MEPFESAMVTDLARFMAEILHNVADDGGRPCVLVGPPRQSHRSLRNIGYDWFRGRTWKGVEVLVAVEDDVQVGRWFDREGCGPRRLPCLADRFAGVETGVRLL